MKIILTRKLVSARPLVFNERTAERRWLSGALIPISLLYSLIIMLRNWLYDHEFLRSVDVGVPVISIGNITVGGTGKTPLVGLIASQLCKEGKRVAIVSRGYRRKSAGPVIVSNGNAILADAVQGGDEPVELAKKVPAAMIAVDTRRVRVSRMIVRQWKPDVILMDDGFQHRALYRNCDCVVVDANMLPDETRILPAGMRREPLRSLERVDIFILTKWQEGIDLEKIRACLHRYSDASVVVCRYVPIMLHDMINNIAMNVDQARGRQCIAFCGIGSPETFYRTLGELGVSIVSAVQFADHHYYTASDIKKIVELAYAQGVEMIFTTEKDAVRLSGSLMKGFKAEVPLVAVEMAVRYVEGEDLLWSRLRKVMQ
ncbi:MAG: tetraacyldisaccharide 4'-kinase [Bacteroidota bacterium]